MKAHIIKIREYSHTKASRVPWGWFWMSLVTYAYTRCVAFQPNLHIKWLMLVLLDGAWGLVKYK